MKAHLLSLVLVSFSFGACEVQLSATDNVFSNADDTSINSSVSLSRQEETIFIGGVIVDSCTGEGIGRAGVTALLRSTSRGSTKTSRAPDGLYRFPLDADFYDIHADATGYQETTINLDGGSEQVNIALTPEIGCGVQNANSYYDDTTGRLVIQNVDVNGTIYLARLDMTGENEFTLLNTIELSNTTGSEPATYNVNTSILHLSNVYWNGKLYNVVMTQDGGVFRIDSVIER